MGTRVPLITTDSKAKEMADKLEMSTAEIGLTVRTTNCLEERGIFTVDDLLHCTARRPVEHFQLWREDAGRGISGVGGDWLLSPWAKRAGIRPAPLPR